MHEDKPSEVIEQNIKQLNSLNKSKASAKQILEKLEVLKTECDKGIQHKVLAGRYLWKANTYIMCINCFRPTWGIHCIVRYTIKL